MELISVGWSPPASNGERVIFQVQDRIQTWLDLCEADPITGETKVLIHEDSKAWTNVLGDPRWLESGDFLWFSERTGHRHVYQYGADGTLVRAVTSGDWGHRTGLNLAHAFVEPHQSAEGSEMMLDLCGDRVPARVIPACPYDPDFIHMRS